MTYDHSSFYCDEEGAAVVAAGAAGAAAAAAPPVQRRNINNKYLVDGQMEKLCRQLKLREVYRV